MSLSKSSAGPGGSMSLLSMLSADDCDEDSPLANPFSEFDDAAGMLVASASERRSQETLARWTMSGDPYDDASQHAATLRRIAAAEHNGSLSAMLEVALHKQAALETSAQEAQKKIKELEMFVENARRDASIALASSAHLTLHYNVGGPRPSSKKAAENVAPASSKILKTSARSHGKYVSGREHIEALGASRLFSDAEGEDTEVSSTIFNLRGSLGRALEKLAVDLYSSSASVLFELIANADDANYGNSAGIREIPTVVISSRGDGYLRFSSNEDGLNIKNVAAMSDIGASTKISKDLSSSSIGHKGVGFKSVFLLSDQPSVASCTSDSKNEDNVSFKFDCVKNGLFGLLVPEWLNAESFDHQWARPEATTLFGLSEPNQLWSNRGTRGLRILLPLKEGASMPDLALDPVVLLLLRKVRKIVFDSSLESSGGRKIITMEGSLQVIASPKADGRDELSLQNGVVKLTEHTVVDAQVNSSESVKEFVLASSKTNGVELTLIFPTAGVEEVSQEQCYCFLPVQRTGLHFGVHSDGWRLTASRQELHESNAINLALRSQISEVLVASLRASEELRRMSSTFVSSPNSLTTHPWWRPVADDCTRLLRNSNLECALSDFGTWLPANRVVLRPPGLSKAIVDSSVLQAISNAEGGTLGFADEGWVAMRSDETLHALGCRYLNPGELLRALVSYRAAEGWLCKKPWKYFDELFGYLNRSLSVEVLAALSACDDAALRILPVVPIGEDQRVDVETEQCDAAQMTLLSAGSAEPAKVMLTSILIDNDKTCVFLSALASRLQSQQMAANGRVYTLAFAEDLWSSEALSFLTRMGIGYADAEAVARNTCFYHLTLTSASTSHLNISWGAFWGGLDFVRSVWTSLSSETKALARASLVAPAVCSKTSDSDVLFVALCTLSPPTLCGHACVHCGTRRHRRGAVESEASNDEAASLAERVRDQKTIHLYAGHHSARDDQQSSDLRTALSWEAWLVEGLSAPPHVDVCSGRRRWRAISDALAGRSGDCAICAHALSNSSYGDFDSSSGGSGEGNGHAVSAEDTSSESDSDDVNDGGSASVQEEVAPSPVPRRRLTHTANVAVLGCGHTFHAACIQEWVWTSSNLKRRGQRNGDNQEDDTGSCPFCRVTFATIIPVGKLEELSALGNALTSTLKALGVHLADDGSNGDAEKGCRRADAATKSARQSNSNGGGVCTGNKYGDANDGDNDIDDDVAVWRLLQRYARDANLIGPLLRSAPVFVGRSRQPTVTIERCFLASAFSMRLSPAVPILRLGGQSRHFPSSSQSSFSSWLTPKRTRHHRGSRVGMSENERFVPFPRVSSGSTSVQGANSGFAGRSSVHGDDNDEDGANESVACSALRSLNVATDRNVATLVDALRGVADAAEACRTLNADVHKSSGSTATTIGNTNRQASEAAAAADSTEANVANGSSGSSEVKSINGPLLCDWDAAHAACVACLDALDDVINSMDSPPQRLAAQRAVHQALCEEALLVVLAPFNRIGRGDFGATANGDSSSSWSGNNSHSSGGVGNKKSMHGGYLLRARDCVWSSSSYEATAGVLRIIALENNLPANLKPFLTGRSRAHVASEEANVCRGPVREFLSTEDVTAALSSLTTRVPKAEVFPATIAVKSDVSYDASLVKGLLQELSRSRHASLQSSPTPWPADIALPVTLYMHSPKLRTAADRKAEPWLSNYFGLSHVVPKVDKAAAAAESPVKQRWTSGGLLTTSTDNRNSCVGNSSSITARKGKSRDLHRGRVKTLSFVSACYPVVVADDDEAAFVFGHCVAFLDTAFLKEASPSLARAVVMGDNPSGSFRSSGKSTGGVNRMGGLVPILSECVHSTITLGYYHGGPASDSSSSSAISSATAQEAASALPQQLPSPSVPPSLESDSALPRGYCPSAEELSAWSRVLGAGLARAGALGDSSPCAVMVAPTLTRTFELTLPVVKATADQPTALSSSSSPNSNLRAEVAPASSSTTASPMLQEPVTHEVAFAVWTTGDPPLEGEVRQGLPSNERAAAAADSWHPDDGLSVVEGSASPVESPSSKKAPGRVVVLSLAHCKWQPVLGPDLKCFGAAAAALARKLDRQARKQSEERGPQRDRYGFWTEEEEEAERSRGNEGALEKGEDEEAATLLESSLEAVARASISGWADVTAAKVKAAQAAADAEEFAKALQESTAEQRFEELFNISASGPSGGDAARSRLEEAGNHALNFPGQDGNRNSMQPVGDGTSGRSRESTHRERLNASAAEHRALLDQAPSVEDLEQSLCNPSPGTIEGERRGPDGYGTGVNSAHEQSADDAFTTALARARENNAFFGATGSKPTPQASTAITAAERFGAERGAVSAAALPSLADGAGAGATTSARATCRVERLHGTSARPCCVCGELVVSGCSKCVDFSHDEIALCAVPHARGEQSCFETFHCIGAIN